MKKIMGNGLNTPVFCSQALSVAVRCDKKADPTHRLHIRKNQPEPAQVVV